MRNQQTVLLTCSASSFTSTIRSLVFSCTSSIFSFRIAALLGEVLEQPELGGVVLGAQQAEDLRVLELQEGGPGDDARGGVVLPGDGRFVPLVSNLHGEGLPNVFLPVGKHGAVVSLHVLDTAG